MTDDCHRSLTLRSQVTSSPIQSLKIFQVAAKLTLSKCNKCITILVVATDTQHSYTITTIKITSSTWREVSYSNKDRLCSTLLDPLLNFESIFFCLLCSHCRQLLHFHRFSLRYIYAMNVSSSFVCYYHFLNCYLVHSKRLIWFGSVCDIGFRTLNN